MQDHDMIVNEIYAEEQEKILTLDNVLAATGTVAVIVVFSVLFSIL